jgi:hypothetical protein
MGVQCHGAGSRRSRGATGHVRRREGGMLEQMPDMPVGTVGFEAIGKVDDDFERAVEPVLRG